MTLPINEAAPLQPVLTCDEVAALLKVSRRKLDYLRKTDRFPQPILPTGHPRFRSTDIIAWLEPVEA